MPGSQHARHNEKIAMALAHAEYIIITPGDIYTSIISNLIIGGVSDLVQESQAKIIYIANITNKGGEASNYCIGDFVSEIERYLRKSIDILIVNNYIPNLSVSEKERFKSNISVKGGEYICLSDTERRDFLERGMQIYEADILEKQSLYKHDQKKIAQILERVIFSHEYDMIGECASDIHHTQG